MDSDVIYQYYIITLFIPHNHWSLIHIKDRLWNKEKTKNDQMIVWIIFQCVPFLIEKLSVLGVMFAAYHVKQGIDKYVFWRGLFLKNSLATQICTDNL